MPKTILVADDSVTIRKVVEMTFQETDIRVDSVGSGREAIERFESTKPDLVLADVILPGPSGYDICQAVKASDHPVPVLLLAGTFEPFDAQRARECGADGHVVKPFESRALLERVVRLLSAPLAPEPAAPPASLEEVLDDLAGPARPPHETPGDALAWLLPPPAATETESLPVPAGPKAEAAPAAPIPQVLEPPEPAAVPALSEAELDAIARAVVARLGDKVLREIAWEVVPDLAESIVRERLRQLEADAESD